MPRLSPSGNVAMGIAGHQGVINGAFIPDSYGPQWMNNDTAVFQQPSNFAISLYDIHTGVRTPQIIRPANDLYAGGNVWALWADHFGLQASTGLYLPDAGLLDVGPDGSVGYVPNRQVGIGANVRELDGTDWILASGNVVYSLQLKGARRAIYNDQFQRIQVVNLPPCIQIGSAYRPRAVEINGQWWVCYFSTTAGTILHPFNSTVGYVIMPPGADAWQHDIVQLGSITKIVWAARAGEAPEDYRERLINVNVEPRVELDPIDPIVNINRPHYLGFFTGKPGVLGGWDTNDDPPEFQDVHALPGNGYLDVPTSTFFNDRDEPVGSFIHSQPGWTVETMEEAARNTQFIPIAYWDARNWPRWPNLPDKSWLCIQAYCGRNEPLNVFEADIRAKLLELRQIKANQKIALVAQAYWQTPVNNLTDDLSGLVPVFSRLVAEFPNVIATIPFNGNGRFNGMQHHPEIRPLWEQFAAGITGEPTVANPQLPSDVCAAVIRERQKYGAIPTRPELAQILNDAAWSIDQGADWGVSRKDQGFNVSSPDRPGLGNIASDILHRKSDNMIWDVLTAAGEAATPNCGEALGEMTDPNRPWVAPVQPPDVPDPEPVGVVIYHADPIFRRSDPFGGLIKYEIGSARPITRAEYYCEGNGEPPIVIEFPVTPGFDGRYIRQIGVKFTVNGVWTLKIKGFNDQGQVGESDGNTRIEVTF